MVQNILITGGNGYLGSNLVQLILQKKKLGINKIIIIDNFSNSDLVKKRKLENLSKEIIFFKFDIINKIKLKNIFKKYKIKTVFHFAALKSVEEAKKYPKKYIKKNISDTASLIHATIGSPVKNIVFSSTAGVYEHNNHNENSENVSVNPTNPYSYSKMVCENILYQLSLKKKIKVIILRLFNIMGHIEKNKIFSKHRGNISDNIIYSLEQKKTFIINSKNTSSEGSIRDFIHVEDVCDANIKAFKFFQLNNRFYHIFNIGSGKSISVKNLIKQFNKYSKIKINYKNSFKKNAGQEKSYANIEKSKKILKWVPKKSIIEICKSEIRSLT